MDQQWQISHVPGTGWHWRCIEQATGSITKMSSVLFPLLYDCVQDARRSGYQAELTISKKPALLIDPQEAIMTVVELNLVLNRIDLRTLEEEKLDVTEDVIQQISRLNGYLNPAEVINALGNGYTVHTESFHYKLA